MQICAIIFSRVIMEVETDYSIQRNFDSRAR